MINPPAGLPIQASLPSESPRRSGATAADRWLRVRRVPLPLLLVAALIASAVAMPLLYVFIRSMGGGAEVWQRLIQTRLAGLMLNTLSLAAAVTLGTSALGFGLAFLVERTDLPGRAVFRWLLAAPLAVPAFIGAIVYVALLRPGGGVLVKAFPWIPFPSPFGFAGAAAILTLFMYPYVYLLAASSLRALHASYEEAARTAGLTTREIVWRVTLPLLRPGLAAGALLVALDILAEYGTVALLRFQTFSAAIFLQLSGRFDRSAASVLSAVLVLLAVLLLWGELRLQGQARFTQVGGTWRPSRILPLGRWKPLAVGLAGGVATLSLVVPLSTLAVWAVQGLLAQSFTENVYRVQYKALGGYAGNSLLAGGGAAVLAVMLSLPVAYLAARYPGRRTRLISRVCQVGYALPGVVVALSLILAVNRLMPVLYASPLIVILAYVIRHMPQAVRGSESALAQVAPGMEEAARSLGRSPLRAFAEVVLPNIFPGLLAAASLVFLTSLKELPATLLLRPAGFDTLAVRVWITANEGVYTQAALPALLLVLVAMVPLAFVLRARSAR